MSSTSSFAGVVGTMLVRMALRIKTFSRNESRFTNPGRARDGVDSAFAGVAVVEFYNIKQAVSEDPEA
jgi:hypothetical protein